MGEIYLVEEIIYYDERLGYMTVPLKAYVDKNKAIKYSGKSETYLVSELSLDRGTCNTG